MKTNFPPLEIHIIKLGQRSDLFTPSCSEQLENSDYTKHYLKQTTVTAFAGDSPEVLSAGTGGSIVLVVCRLIYSANPIISISSFI